MNSQFICCVFHCCLTTASLSLLSLALYFFVKRINCVCALFFLLTHLEECRVDSWWPLVILFSLDIGVVVRFEFKKKECSIKERWMAKPEEEEETRAPSKERLSGQSRSSFSTSTTKPRKWCSYIWYCCYFARSFLSVVIFRWPY